LKNKGNKIGKGTSLADVTYNVINQLRGAFFEDFFATIASGR
jgi:hypothetical protein